MAPRSGPIIQTKKTEARKSWLAFLLSLVFPGLGQMYNGDLPKGAAFLLLRTMPLLIGPVAVLRWNPVSCVKILMACALAWMIIPLFAALESLLAARRGVLLPVRVYNAVRYYLAYGAVCGLLSFLCALPSVFFFRVDPVEGAGKAPLMEEGDWMVTRVYNGPGYARADLVVLGNGFTGRIMALEGDAVRHADNIFFINDRGLPLGYIRDDMIRSFSRDAYDVVSESNEGRKYPVRFRAADHLSLPGLKTPVPRGHALLAADTRAGDDFCAMIPLESISARVEGILFSRNLRKIGMNACADLK